MTGATQAGAKDKPTKIQRAQEQAVTDVPRCTRKLGTVSVMDGDDPSGWTQFQLAGPQKLLKVLIQRSGCFNLVDRGSGLSAAQRERDIGGGLGLQRRSNVGQGQIKTADYVLVAEVQASNRNAGGGGMGVAGAIIGGPIGGLLGGFKKRKMEANTVLSLTNVRTTETMSVQDGYATKTDTSWGAGGGGIVSDGGLAAVGGGYDNTDIGRIVTLAFIQAYSKMVDELGLVRPGATATAEASPTKTFTAQGPVAMRLTASPKGRVLRTLPPGSILYPTGEKNGLWWQVADENDNIGWVMNTKLAPSF